jgi:hypothetical protein
MQWLKARRKLMVGILMGVTLIVFYSAKSNEPVTTFFVLVVVASVLIVLEVYVLRLLNRRDNTDG